MGPPKYSSDYLDVIRSVGRVLEPYDTDKMITTYGFGANINPHGQKRISHCFPLSFNDDNPDLAGIDGVIEAYQAALVRVQLYGPTVWMVLVLLCKLIVILVCCVCVL